MSHCSMQLVLALSFWFLTVRKILRLHSLELGFNFLTGTIPSEIGKMTMLKRFSAPFNLLMGEGKSACGDG